MNDIKEYLNAASAHAGDYKTRMGILENDAPECLKAILQHPEYWRLSYNYEKEGYIIKALALELTEEERHQLGGFVYLHNVKRREEVEKEVENHILSMGYEKISAATPTLDKVKVRGYFKVSRNGILGSSESLEQAEGTLVYVERFKGLMLIPKGNRTRGFLIRDYAYIAKVI